MQTGTIKRLTDRGFGFIAIEGSEKDLFFHSNELKGVAFEDLKEGDKVQFEVTSSPKGENATNVSRDTEAGAAPEAADAPVAEEATEEEKEEEVQEAA